MSEQEQGSFEALDRLYTVKERIASTLSRDSLEQLEDAIQLVAIRFGAAPLPKE